MHQLKNNELICDCHYIYTTDLFLFDKECAAQMHSKKNILKKENKKNTFSAFGEKNSNLSSIFVCM